MMGKRKIDFELFLFVKNGVRFRKYFLIYVSINQVTFFFQIKGVKC